MFRSWRDGTGGRPTAQADLFAADSSAGPVFKTVVSEAYVQGIRDELHRTLAMVTAATGDPWSNPTQSILAQMRFQSIASTWLPAAEAADLWQRFDAEIIRIYGPGDEDDA
jgi:hypothetical protein